MTNTAILKKYKALCAKVEKLTAEFNELSKQFDALSVKIAKKERALSQVVDERDNFKYNVIDLL